MILVYWLTICILGVIRLYHYHKNSHNVAKNFTGQLEYLVFSGVVVFGLIIPLISMYFFSSWNYSVSIGLQYIGLFCLFLAVILFIQTLIDLGSQDSPTLQIKHDHQLINSGVYHFVRHPMYAGGLLIILSHILLVPNIISVISTFITFLVLVMFRIPAEEEMLHKEFGRKYELYKQNTCALIPKLCHII